MGGKPITPAPDADRGGRALALAAIIISAAAWLGVAHTIWRASGLFTWIGIDFSLFWAATRAMLDRGPVAAYDKAAVTAAIAPLTAYYAPAFPTLPVGPPPYPPIFLLLMTPFTVVPPAVGLTLWTVANATVAVLVVRGLTGRIPGASWVHFGALLAFLPLEYTLLVGQPIVLLLAALYLGYCALEQGRDFKAGLWIGVLLCKPQYAVFLALVLFGKRRWRAVAGMAVVGSGLLLSSLAMLGVSGLMTYVAMLHYASGFRNVDPIVLPEQMVGWRGLLVNFLPPSVSEAQGVALTFVLSAITAASLLSIWRGPWAPRSDRFAVQMLATMAVTMLCSFHNHVHGALLLLVPGAIVVGQGSAPRPLQTLLRFGLLAPSAVFFLTFYYSVSFTALTFTLLLSIGLGGIVLFEWLASTGHGWHVLERSEAVRLSAGCG